MHAVLLHYLDVAIDPTLHAGADSALYRHATGSVLFRRLLTDSLAAALGTRIPLTSAALQNSGFEILVFLTELVRARVLPPDIPSVYFRRLLAVHDLHLHQFGRSQRFIKSWCALAKRLDDKAGGAAGGMEVEEAKLMKNVVDHCFRELEEYLRVDEMKMPLTVRLMLMVSIFSRSS